jgi:hypothetical protein
MSAIQWLAPRPLWADFADPSSRAAFRRPALLRFAKDTFMEDLQTLLANKSVDLRKYVARPESWREPAAGLPAPGTSTTGVIGAPPPRFRLYQPLHQRFYLLSAALACRLPGLPDHTVKPDEGESIGFVIRRVDPTTTSTTAVFNPATRQEFAWIDGERPGWRLVSTTGLAAGEQEMALFPMAYGENGSRRRMLAGLIPVGRRQEYVSGRTLPALSSAALATAAPGDDPRIIDLQRTLIDPWAEQIDLFNNKLSAADKANPDIRFSLDQGAALILLDFLNFLLEQAPAVGGKIVDPSAPSPTGAGLTLYNTLTATIVTNQDTLAPVSLAEAMRKAKERESIFESATLQTNTAPTLPPGYPRVSLLQNSALPLMNKNSADVRAIQTLVAPALTTPISDSPPRIPAKDPVSPVGNVWFVARCLYKRPQCGPNSRVLLSDPTEPFQLASIFDPDAPARMSQVALPLDTTPAGLRKHDKSVAFMVSDELSKQMARIKGLKELTEGDVGGPGIGIGFICSLSIPIITLCAFIVLMIFIVLLNIIFWWMPFFKICFPIPMPAKGDA